VPVATTPSDSPGAPDTNKIVVFEGAPRHIDEIFPVKITRASGSTLYGDPAILE
jgi:tRNA-2-methylthio-N6-dimethylallyladenosine synthase